MSVRVPWKTGTKTELEEQEIMLEGMHDSARGEGTGLSREGIPTGMRSDTRERREGRRRGIEEEEGHPAVQL